MKKKNLNLIQTENVDTFGAQYQIISPVENISPKKYSSPDQRIKNL